MHAERAVGRVGLIASSSSSSVIKAGQGARDGPVAGAFEGEVSHMVPVGFHMWTGSSSTMGLQKEVVVGLVVGQCELVAVVSPREGVIRDYRWLGVWLVVILGFL